LEWISKQGQAGDFRIGPFTTGEGGLNQMLKLGLFHVGGVDTRGAFLTRYSGLVSERASYKILGLLNVKYLVFNQRSDSKDLKLVYNATPWLVYENRYSLPRAFCVERAILIVGRDNEVFQTQNDLIGADYYDLNKIAMVRGESFRAEDYDSEFLKRFDLVVLLPWGGPSDENRLTEKCVQVGVPLVKNFVTLEEYLKKSALSAKAGLSIPGEITKLSPNKVVVKVRSDTRRFLVLSEVMYPGWKAYVDGKEVPILSAYSALRGVFLNTPGEHEISFTYDSATFVVGSYVTLIALLVVASVEVRGKAKSFRSGSSKPF
jgi:hypothetical protein